MPKFRQGPDATQRAEQSGARAELELCEPACRLIQSCRGENPTKPPKIRERSYLRGHTRSREKYAAVAVPEGGVPHNG